MASTNLNVANNIASIVSGSEIRSVQDEFETLRLPDTPLPSWIPKGGAVHLGTSLKYEVPVDRLPNRTVTVTANVVTADTSLTMSTSDVARLQKNHLLYVDSELILVTTIGSSTTVGVSKGFGGTTSTTHTTSSVVQILSPVFAESDSFQQSATIRGEFTSYYPWLILYSYAETGIRASSRNYLEKNMDALDFDTKTRHQKVAMAEFERLLLHSSQSIISATVQGAPKGIRALISTNNTAVSGVLTATSIEDMLDQMFALDGSDGITIMGNRKMHRIWSAVFNQYFNRQGDVSTDKVGVKVWTYQSALGDFKFMPVDACLDGELLFLRKGDLKIHDLDMGPFGTGWQEFERGPKETNAVTRSRNFYNAGLLVMGDERRHGKLTGITSTLSSYAGAV